MLSKNQERFIKRLRRKKNRAEEGLFIAEGVKLVNELLNSDLQLFKLFHLEESSFEAPADKCQHISATELKKVSALSAPNQVLALFKIPEQKEAKRQGLSLVLDDINDPGNLGTLIRLADWFGLNQIICGLNSVDCYNAKVVQSSMGSLGRVDILYLDLEVFLREEKRKVYGTFMDGDSVYSESLESEAVLILGNEANGISESVEALVNQRLSIPQFGDAQKTESLNVAMAGAIFLSEFRRR